MGPRLALIDLARLAWLRRRQVIILASAFAIAVCAWTVVASSRFSPVELKAIVYGSATGIVRVSGHSGIADVTTPSRPSTQVELLPDRDIEVLVAARGRQVETSGRELAWRDERLSSLYPRTQLQPQGQVALSAHLASTLGVDTGQSVRVGSTTLTVGAVIVPPTDSTSDLLLVEPGTLATSDMQQAQTPRWFAMGPLSTADVVSLDAQGFSVQRSSELPSSDQLPPWTALLGPASAVLVLAVGVVATLSEGRYWRARSSTMDRLGARRRMMLAFVVTNTVVATGAALALGTAGGLLASVPVQRLVAWACGSTWRWKPSSPLTPAICAVAGAALALCMRIAMSTPRPGKDRTTRPPTATACVSIAALVGAALSDDLVSLILASTAVIGLMAVALWVARRLTFRRHRTARISWALRPGSETRDGATSLWAVVAMSGACVVTTSIISIADVTAHIHSQARLDDLPPATAVARLGRPLTTLELDHWSSVHDSQPAQWRTAVIGGQERPWVVEDEYVRCLEAGQAHSSCVGASSIPSMRTVALVNDLPAAQALLGVDLTAQERAALTSGTLLQAVADPATSGTEVDLVPMPSSREAAGTHRVHVATRPVRTHRWIGVPPLVALRTAPRPADLSASAQAWLLLPASPMRPWDEATARQGLPHGVAMTLQTPVDDDTSERFHRVAQLSTLVGVVVCAILTTLTCWLVVARDMRDRTILRALGMSAPTLAGLNIVRAAAAGAPAIACSYLGSVFLIRFFLDRAGVDLPWSWSVSPWPIVTVATTCVAVAMAASLLDDGHTAGARTGPIGY
ncbi:FtsX-like permease family protein [Acidipropionibacterium timonense]|uniref:FtsX-like permease family protein n=1 Tax=Acidipropionibacterium timonense TaxID=2161818 RepID=UPI0010318847|nr:FtsX-like permease family protein [Acidipropionibacterium timonense]